MGRRRGRGQRVFDPNKKRDIGQEVIDKFNTTWEKISELTRQRALSIFVEAIQADRESHVGELIVESQSSAMTMTGFDLGRKRSEMRQERERVQKMVQEEEEKIERSLEVSRDAANAAFPGVEDD